MYIITLDAFSFINNFVLLLFNFPDVILIPVPQYNISPSVIALFIISGNSISVIPASTVFFIVAQYAIGLPILFTVEGILRSLKFMQ